jgi:hypothetical protein
MAKFRHFAGVCLVLSFVVLACEIFDPMSINEWFSKRNINFLRVPSVDIAMIVFVCHATNFIAIDALFGSYKKKSSEVLTMNQETLDVQALEEEDIVIQVIEIS